MIGSILFLLLGEKPDEPAYVHSSLRAKVIRDVITHLGRVTNSGRCMREGI